MFGSLSVGFANEKCETTKVISHFRKQ